jgi:hypothetical protein
MNPEACTPAPSDARDRRHAEPVLVYPTGTLPHHDAGLLDHARTTLTKVSETDVPPRDARAVTIKAGQFFRILSLEDAQIGDLNLWNAHDLSERFYSGNTRALHGTHLGLGDRMWSRFPHLRPTATITWDTLDWFGWDADGGGVHDIIGTRSAPYTNGLIGHDPYHHCCHSKLTHGLDAATGMSLTEPEPLVHDVLNVFMCTGFSLDTRQYFIKANPVRPGDYLKFLAEIDLLAALSPCPGGDCGTKHSSVTAGCHPRVIEVFDAAPDALRGWKQPEPAPYDLSHGA